MPSVVLEALQRELTELISMDGGEGFIVVPKILDLAHVVSFSRDMVAFLNKRDTWFARW